MNFFLEEPARARLIMRELMDRPEEMGEYLNRYITPWIQLIAEQVQLARQKGNISADVDPSAFVWVMVSSVMANVALAGTVQLPYDGAENASSTSKERLTHELIRMARSSLFTTDSAALSSSAKGDSPHHG